MQARQEALPDVELLSPTGLFLITEDQLSVAPYVAEALQQKGCSTAIIPTATLSSSQALAQVVAQQRQIHGPISGIVHLAPLAAIPLPEAISDWRQYTQIHSKSLFQLLQLCADDLRQAGQQERGRVLAASFLGGYFSRVSGTEHDSVLGCSQRRTKGQGDKEMGGEIEGLEPLLPTVTQPDKETKRQLPLSSCLPIPLSSSGELGLPTGGSSNGLLKTLVTEWSGVHTKAIDFDSSLSAPDMAQHIINELLLPGGRIEVGYPQGKRTIFQTVLAPLDTTTKTPQLTPSADWVVLVTGGARGITSEITSELLVPGMTLIVVGRSPEPSEESPATARIDDIGALRRVLLEQARSQGLSPTPMQIERQLMALMRDRAIRRNLQRFRQSGATIDYLPVDVKSAEDFGYLIDDIYARYGRLDVVIHGAGIIEDKLITDKTFASFERVFDTKVDSTFILSRYLRPDSLKALVLFSSVAGRYGNRGQSDYAAANETINRLAWLLDQQWSNTRVVSINWGPWDTVGMASEEVKRQFRERGIVPIPLAAGRQFFIDELRYGRKGEAEVSAGEGPWEADEVEKGQLKLNCSLVYDAVLPDQTGEVRLHLMDGQSTSNPALNRLANQ
jgi:NAD(P)-dependent dehydrogenase (short-subunit alcohol dehydrogenase family)